MSLRFLHRSIRAKVFAAYGLVFAAMLGLGGIAMDSLGTINHEAAAVRDHWLPSVQALAQLTIDAERHRANVGYHVMAPTEADRVKTAADTQGMVELVARGRAAYEPLVAGGEERRLADRFDQQWADYLGHAKQALALATNGETAQAQALFRGPMRGAFQQARATLAEGMALNSRGGHAAVERGAAVYRSTRLVILGALLVAALLTLGAASAIVRSVARPVSAMTAAMRRLAERDTTVEIPHAGRGDEVGAMAGAVQVFRDNMVEADRLAAEQRAEQAAKEARAARMAGLVEGFERRVGNLVGIVAASATELQATAGCMSATAEMTTGQAGQVAASAQQTAAGVQSVAAATEELTASVGEITRQVAQAARRTGQAAEDARLTDAVVRRLSEGTARIGDVVGLISSIAGQTNLLALNATIEAARAGAAGKGFAVVASEVKSLAQQTAKATEEIGTQVGQVQAATREAVEAVSGITQAIAELNGVAAAIAAAVEEQGAATAEIARNAQDAATGTEQVTGTIAEVSHGAGETGAAAGEVLGAATELSRQAEALQAEVGRFVAEVQAA